jgi:hypothetical protein
MAYQSEENLGRLKIGILEDVMDHISTTFERFVPLIM